MPGSPPQLPAPPSGRSERDVPADQAHILGSLPLPLARTRLGRRLGVLWHRATCSGWRPLPLAQTCRDRRLGVLWHRATCSGWRPLPLAQTCRGRRLGVLWHRATCSGWRPLPLAQTRLGRRLDTKLSAGRRRPMGWRPPLPGVPRCRAQHQKGQARAGSQGSLWRRPRSPRPGRRLAAPTLRARVEGFSATASRTSSRSSHARRASTPNLACRFAATLAPPRHPGAWATMRAINADDAGLALAPPTQPLPRCGGPTGGGCLG